MAWCPKPLPVPLLGIAWRWIGDKSLPEPMMTVFHWRIHASSAPRELHKKHFDLPSCFISIVLIIFLIIVSLCFSLLVGRRYSVPSKMNSLVSVRESLILSSVLCSVLSASYLGCPWWQIPDFISSISWMITVVVIHCSSLLLQNYWSWAMFMVSCSFAN